MAERKAVNKYYPPDWDPSKGSVNKYQGSHPLRDRAKKLSQGILTIRFELPYNIWCGGCNSHIGMGVRYNAEKKKVGNYYTTPIYKFRMKCHLCDNYFEIQTDPKNHDYVILCGARRKEQRWDPKENEQIVPEDKATHKKLVTDPMYKLEHGSDDINKKKGAVPSLQIIEHRLTEKKDDYILNKLARKKFRDQKNAMKSKEEANKNLLMKSSLDIKLVNEDEDDVKLAGLLKYRALETYDEKQQQKRREIDSRTLFHSPSATSPSSDSASDTQNNVIKKLGLNVNSTPNPFDLNNTSKSKKSLTPTGLGVSVKSSSKTSNEKCDKSCERATRKGDLSESVNDNLIPISDAICCQLNSSNINNTEKDTADCTKMEVELESDVTSEKQKNNALLNLSAYGDSDVSD